jgi:hypothetical protein
MGQNPAFETRPANKQEDLLAHPPRYLTPSLWLSNHQCTNTKHHVVTTWQNPAFETRPSNKQEELLAHPPLTPLSLVGKPPPLTNTKHTPFLSHPLCASHLLDGTPPPPRSLAVVIIMYKRPMPTHGPAQLVAGSSRGDIPFLLHPLKAGYLTSNHKYERSSSCEFNKSTNQSIFSKFIVYF